MLEVEDALAKKEVREGGREGADEGRREWHVRAVVGRGEWEIEAHIGVESAEVHRGCWVETDTEVSITGKVSLGYDHAERRSGSASRKDTYSLQSSLKHHRRDATYRPNGSPMLTQPLCFSYAPSSKALCTALVDAADSKAGRPEKRG